MKVTLHFPMEDVDAQVRAYDTDGDLVQLSRVEISPFFFGAGAVAPAVYGTITAQPAGKEESVIQRFSLGISGTDGRYRMNSRKGQVRPKLERELADDVDTADESPDGEGESELDEEDLS